MVNHWQIHVKSMSIFSVIPLAQERKVVEQLKRGTTHE